METLVVTMLASNGHVGADMFCSCFLFVVIDVVFSVVDSSLAFWYKKVRMPCQNVETVHAVI